MGTPRELSWWEWRVLSLVNEKIRVTVGTLAFLLYSNATAEPRIREILQILHDQSMVSEYSDGRWQMDDAGFEYVEHALKPPKPLRL